MKATRSSETLLSLKRIHDPDNHNLFSFYNLNIKIKYYLTKHRILAFEMDFYINVRNP